MQEVTSMSTANEKQKKELLASTNLLEEYENSGCSEDQAYGVDCGVVETTMSTENVENMPDNLDEITSSTVNEDATNNNNSKSIDEATTENEKKSILNKKNKLSEEAATDSATEVTSNEKADDTKVVAFLEKESEPEESKNEVTTDDETTKEITTDDESENEVTTPATHEVTTSAPTIEEATTSPSTGGGSMYYYNKLKSDPNANYIIQKKVVGIHMQQMQVVERMGFVKQNQLQKWHQQDQIT